MDSLTQAEQARLDELYGFDLLDTPRTSEYDRLVRMAAKHCGAPIALITLVDEGRQWFKSAIGLEATETARSISFCTHTIELGQTMIVPDGRLDPRFRDNPLVTGPPGIVFYAGVPLATQRKHILGTLAVIHTRPHELNADQLELLEILAEQVMAQFELRRHATLLTHMTHERDALRLAQLRESQRRYEKLAKATTDTIWDWNLVTDTVVWNDGLQTCFGYRLEDIAPDSSSWTSRIHPDDVGRVVSEIHAVIDSGKDAWEAHYRFRRADGSYADVFDRGFVLHDKMHAPVQMIGGISDISARREMEEAHQKIRQLAFYDALTGLPNRACLMARLHKAFDAAKNDGSTGCLLFIDLDNFKDLNDTLGHDRGDLLLREVAVRLNCCVRSVDMVARLGGDEFVVLLENLPGGHATQHAIAERLASKILHSFTSPFVLGPDIRRSTPSIGIAFFHGHDVSVEALLRYADLAMYQSKAAGRNTVRFFTPEMETALTGRKQLESELDTALANSQFHLHYQPLFYAEGGPYGAEALLRWSHPVRGSVGPGEFITLVEETGQIIGIGRWVLRTACTQLAIWSQHPQTAPLTLSVNISIRQFCQPDFAQQVLDIVGSTGANPHLLRLELTESVFVSDVEATVYTMNTLRAAGVRFSLDDFGTGYSSLAYLKQLPLEQLKIDRSFVRDITNNVNGAVIAQTVIALASSLRLTTVAEGVETLEQFEFLKESGCGAFQGFLLGQPVSIDEFTRLWMPDCPDC